MKWLKSRRRKTENGNSEKRIVSLWCEHLVDPVARKCKWMCRLDSGDQFVAYCVAEDVQAKQFGLGQLIINQNEKGYCYDRENCIYFWNWGSQWAAEVF